jgi:hypothetical protein
MNMVGHQHVSMHVTAAGPGGLEQPIDKTRAVEVRKEASVAIITALNNMQGNPWQYEASRPGHGLSILEKRERLFFIVAGNLETLNLQRPSRSGHQ